MRPSPTSVSENPLREAGSSKPRSYPRWLINGAYVAGAILFPFAMAGMHFLIAERWMPRARYYYFVSVLLGVAAGSICLCRLPIFLSSNSPVHSLCVRLRFRRLDLRRHDCGGSCRPSILTSDGGDPSRIRANPYDNPRRRSPPRAASSGPARRGTAESAPFLAQTGRTGFRDRIMNRFVWMILGLLLLVASIAGVNSLQ